MHGFSHTSYLKITTKIIIILQLGHESPCMPSIHPSIFYNCFLFTQTRCWSLSQLSLVKGGVTPLHTQTEIPLNNPWVLYVLRFIARPHRKTNNYSHSYLQSIWSHRFTSCLFLKYGKKLENNYTPARDKTCDLCKTFKKTICCKL